MRKGFIHIVEIVIVIATVFMMVFQLLDTPGIDTDWSGIMLKTRANDMLFTLDEAGVNWFSRDQVDSMISSTLDASNIVYSVRLSNVIEPLIRVGCVCDDSEFNAISRILSVTAPDTPSVPSFSINGQGPGFVLSRIEPSTGPGTFPEMSSVHDVIIVGDHDIGYAKALKYLSNDGGLIEIRDLDQSLAAPGSGSIADVHNMLLGVKWESALDAPSGLQSAFVAMHPNSSYYNVYRYFLHIPNSTGDRIEAGYKFDGMLGASEKINVTSPAARALIAQEGTKPVLVLNRASAANRGRTAWLSAPSVGLENVNMDDGLGTLIKSLVIWASGESYDLLPSVSMSNPASASMYKVYKGDMMQPVEISISMGTIY